MFIAVLAAAAATCGGSTAVETVVGPDPVRCTTTLTAPTTPVPHDGGSVNVSVTAARDCIWSATAESPWMQLSATSGQGDATLAVTITRNDLAAARSGAISVNNQRATISQEPRPCTYELRASTQSLRSEGGRGTVAIETLSGCNWTAASSAAWLQVLTASGSGSGSAGFEAAANPGPAREASIAIAGQSVTIGQAAAQPGGPPPCTATLTPPTINASAAGGTHTVSLTTTASCDWVATSSAPWLAVAPGNGRGTLPLTLMVARNTGLARTATVQAGGQSTTVNQAAAPACTATIDPGTLSFTAAGGEGRVRVTTPDGCEWTSSGGATWTVITNGRGTGNGEARYTVQPNTSTSARSTTLTIGGHSHSVSQQAAAPTCTYSLDPAARTVAAGGGDGTVTVTTQAGCAWSASTTLPWISLNGGQGTGPGQFAYTVQANTGAARSGGISVSGQTHTVNQDAAAATCTFSVQPTSQNFGVAGGGGQFNVVTQADCAWTTSGGAAWATVNTSGGTGPGQVSYTVQANTATSTRQTTIIVNGQSHSVTQDAAAPTCTYSLQPASQNFAAAGGTGQFNVVTQAGCAWTASSGAPWATTTSTGTGPGQVSYSVQANTATATRQTAITVSGQSHSVTQDAAAGAEGER